MKRYSIGLITGILFTASAFMFIGAQNKFLGDIAVSSINIVDEKGTVCGYIGSQDSYPVIHFYDKNLRSAYISSDLITLGNSSGNPFIAMGAEDSSGGVFKVYNNNNKVVMELISTKYGGGLFTMNNSEGNEIAGIGSNLHKDGLIIIRDKNGNFGWGMAGMKELKNN
tara:strand:+ start:124 stop:627 length:504 start_codon:yes stop_codon:yes gene_type:complete